MKRFGSDPKKVISKYYYDISININTNLVNFLSKIKDQYYCTPKWKNTNHLFRVTAKDLRQAREIIDMTRFICYH